MYVSDEGERVLFQVPTDLSLHNLGVYISSNMDDNSIIQTIKTLVLQDNTMGADLLDKVTALTSKSVSEIYSKLKDLSIDKQAQETKQYQQEQNLVQQQIESQEKQLQAKLQEEARQSQLDRESNERIAEIKVIGQSSFSEGDGYEELLKLKQMQDKEKQSYNTLLAKLNQDTNALLANRQNTNIAQQADKEKRDIEREKLQIDREKILADLKKSQNQLLIAKTNKNRYSK
jgi:hypothetical protein